MEIAVPHVFMIFVLVDGVMSSDKTPLIHCYLNNVMRQHLVLCLFHCLSPQHLVPCFFHSLSQQHLVPYFLPCFALCHLKICFQHYLVRRQWLLCFGHCLALHSSTSCTAFGLLLLALLFALLAYVNQVKHTPAETLQRYTPQGQESPNTLWSLSCRAAFLPC